MKEHLQEYFSSRIKAIFTYTSNKWYYVALKTLCVVIGVPLYFVMVPLDFLTFVLYALFSWIPILNTVMLVLCKLLSFVFSIGYYIAILPDAKKYADIAREKLRFEKEMEEQTKNEKHDNENQTDTEIEGLSKEEKDNAIDVSEKE
ncbi:MAG TPA: hypothetical protein PK675_00780 [Clostridia bacterium]|nr:hypothetical protein [Clostridia bacterium]